MPENVEDERIQLACGQCIGCRLDRSRSWALRCHHEAMSHERVSFLTLTYAQDPWTLRHEDFQLFMKRLRKRLGLPIRFYMAGEYGSVYDHRGNKIPGLLGRPHYHCILYGYDFPERELHGRSNTGFDMYNARLLDECWKGYDDALGHAVVQDFSIEAAAYVARYCTKKVNGELADEHYVRINTDTGEVRRVAPEYNRMSNRPGIGSRWLLHYGKTDLYPKDFVTVKDGDRFRPPRYYDKLMEEIDPELMEKVKARRRENVEILPRLRLEQMEACKKAQADKLVRQL